jgi:hypothetical protein
MITLIKLINSLTHYLNISQRIGDVISRYKGDLWKTETNSRSLNGLNAAIESNLKGYGRTRKDSSFPLLPNVSNFDIKLNIYNPLLLGYGILSKYLPETKFERNSSDHINRYLRYMELRLVKSKQNPKLYWAISLILIKRSKSYLIACLQSIDRNWYRKLPIKSLRQIIKEVRQANGYYTGKLNPSIEMSRVYVPKV